jgi:hypothetical protein
MTMPGLTGRMVRRGLYEMMTITARFPWLVVPAATWRGHGVPLSADTDVLIEGFPRSANTFTVAAFATAQPHPVRIAHHLHAPGHVVAAVRRGVPALVLIREPEDAVLEFARIKPALTIAQALRGYVRFYQPLLPYRDRFVVGTFGDVTFDLGSVIGRINARFGTSFAEFEHTEENVARSQPAMDRYWRVRTGPGLPLLGRASGGDAGSQDDEAVSRSRYRGPRLNTLRRKASGLYRALAE